MNQEDYLALKAWTDDVRDISIQVLRKDKVGWLQTIKTGKLRKFIRRGKYLIEDLPTLH